MSPDRPRGRPRTHGADSRIGITARLDPELVSRLDEEARDREVGRNYLIDRALRYYLAALIPADEICQTLNPKGNTP